MEKVKPSIAVDGSVKMVQWLWKIVWQFLLRLNAELLYDPAISPLGIHPREMNIRPYETLYSCSQQHIHNSQKVKTIQCPSTNEQINKIWHIHTMKYYSAVIKE